MGSRGLIPDDNVHRVPLNLLSRPLHPTRQFCHALKMTTTQIDFMNRDDDAKSIYASAGLPMSIRLERDGRNGKWCVVLILDSQVPTKTKTHINLSNIGGWSAINSLISFYAQHMPRKHPEKEKTLNGFLPYNDPKCMCTVPYPVRAIIVQAWLGCHQINKNMSFSVPLTGVGGCYIFSLVTYSPFVTLYRCLCNQLYFI